jgi:hypothetical protein
MGCESLVYSTSAQAVQKGARGVARACKRGAPLPAAQNPPTGRGGEVRWNGDQAAAAQLKENTVMRARFDPDDRRAQVDLMRWTMDTIGVRREARAEILRMAFSRAPRTYRRPA